MSDHGIEKSTNGLFDTPEARQAQKEIVDAVIRGIAREMILSGEVEVGVSREELSKAAWRRLIELRETGEFSFSMVVDHTDTILQDARKYVDEGKLEYDFVFYGLYLEHLLNRAIRDRAFQIGLSEAETMEVMKKSLHDKTGVIWLLMFDEQFPESLAADIRATAAERNAFIHYKWKPDPTTDMLYDEIKRLEERSVATAERAALALLDYVDALVIPPDSESFSWLTRSSQSSRETLRKE
ncbi:hypothetical protein ASF79_09925 [Agreia sp. Leaf335]|uniref:hypothetical protein n=1 Tax=Agreia sp. Leaf335 TaxID=1736340 RepID=UPI0006F642EA|nr:hypothetical protein [Agreia sp. Leaf335]KQR22537.1 hypothetical protein ASF79_09925 [Agreia sp. Leaf335]